MGAGSDGVLGRPLCAGRGWPVWCERGALHEPGEESPMAEGIECEATGLQEGLCCSPCPQEPPLDTALGLIPTVGTPGEPGLGTPASGWGPPGRWPGRLPFSSLLWPSGSGPGWLGSAGKGLQEGCPQLSCLCPSRPLFRSGRMSAPRPVWELAELAHTHMCAYAHGSQPRCPRPWPGLLPSPPPCPPCTGLPLGAHGAWSPDGVGGLRPAQGLCLYVSDTVLGPSPDLSRGWGRLSH